MKKITMHIVFALLLITVYIFTAFQSHPEVFSYQFSYEIVEKYLCSQSITWEPPCERLFLSDSDVHIGAAYVYLQGADPTVYHFEHGPLMKYLYGATIFLTNNPFHLEIFLGIIYVVLGYVFAYAVFKSKTVAVLTGLALAIDPLLIRLTADASFELGQAVFMLAYGLSVLYWRKNYVVHGILLGLFASSKFWGAVPFFVLFFYGFLFFKKKTHIKQFLLHLLIAIATYSLTYLRTFIIHGGRFNILWYQLRVLKFWFQHSSSNAPFAPILLFFLGPYGQPLTGLPTVQAENWSLLRPTAASVTGAMAFVKIRIKAYNANLLVMLLPLAYLAYLSIQAPFERYFILVLPFFYMTLAHVVVKAYENYRKST